MKIKLLLPLFIIFSLFFVSCAHASKIREESSIIKQKIEKARKQNAIKLGCGPKELALAEANREFAEAELAQGDWRQANIHIVKSRKYINIALKKSKPCEIVDNDKDGILNQHDKCPNIPEDKDQFEDEDGCPDVDNDKDGICDPWVSKDGELEKYKDICKGVDQCPNEPEVINGNKDEDGCPDFDKDGDGIFDDVDKCPENAEDKDGFEDEDGCPDLDNDKDGVLDLQDKCPLIPEDIDMFQDEDGCPDPDNDKDGFLDKQDKCPNDAEDKDGFEDEDGCPDLDNDKDGICDPWVSKDPVIADKFKDICVGTDKCPLEPEDKDNFEDEDGCPEEGPKKYTLIEVKADKIELKQKVYFASGKAKIRSRSFNMLNQIADALLSRKKIKVRIEGHTDSRGSARYNKKLSQRRADAVKKYLVKKGVNSDQLESVGYGEEKPIASNKSRKGRESNRRVEFNIVK